MKLINLHYLSILSMIFIITGLILNHQVMVANFGKMPVKSEIIESTGKHIPFTIDEQINLPILADRFHIFNKIMSLGDLILYLGIVLWLFLESLIRMKCTKEPKETGGDK